MIFQNKKYLVKAFIIVLVNLNFSASNLNIRLSIPPSETYLQEAESSLEIQLTGDELLEDTNTLFGNRYEPTYSEDNRAKLFKNMSKELQRDFERLLNIKTFLPKNPIILEAGARFGKDTVLMSKIWPEGLIHAFEPLPSSIEIFKRNTQGHSNIVFYPYALGDKTGQVLFYVNINNPGGSSLNKPLIFAPGVYELEPIEVTCLSASDWISQYDITHIDFMWLDMEGSELTFLKALPKNILETVKAIYIEVLPTVRPWEGSYTYSEISAWLESQGYQINQEFKDHPKIWNTLFVRQQVARYDNDSERERFFYQ